MSPILNAARDAARSGQVLEPRSDLGEISLYISTRFGMVERLVQRLNSGAERLILAGKDHRDENVFTAEREGYVLWVDQALLYDLLIDLDAILFELTAIIDLFKCLLELICIHTGVAVPKDLGKELKRILVSTGEDTTWFSRLNEHRNFFAHNGTPFLAIDITGDSWDVIVMKKNVKWFESQGDYFKLSDVNSVMQGFFSSRIILQHHLVGLYQNSEKAQVESKSLVPTDDGLGD